MMLDIFNKKPVDTVINPSFSLVKYSDCRLDTCSSTWKISLGSKQLTESQVNLILSNEKSMSFLKNL